MLQGNLRRLLLVSLLLSAYEVSAQERFILRAMASSVPAIAGRHALVVQSAPDAHNLYLVIVTDTRTPDQVIAELSADPDVLGIEHDLGVVVSEVAHSGNLSQSTAAILDALNGRSLTSYFGASVWNSYVDQAATDLVRLSNVQDMATGVGIIAIVDTGVDPQQPVLARSLVRGYDFIHGIAGIASELSDLDPNTAVIFGQPASAAVDRNTVVQVNQSTAAILDQSSAAILDTSRLPAAFGHGTMVAGIVHLIAPTAQIMPLKAFTDDGTANLIDIVRAVYFAVDNGARVLNMSFNLDGTSIELMKALNYATAHGVISVGSVGNSGLETLEFPAGFQNVIGVASTDRFDLRSSFSNYGAAMASLAAPGEDIVTIYPGGNYAVVSGTSFAAPFVSGGAGLLNQLRSKLDQTGAKAALSNARKLTPELGSGRLDLYQAAMTVRH